MFNIFNFVKNSFLIFSACTAAYLLFTISNAQPEIPPIYTTIVKVHDGDTFITANGETIRLLNINSPESCGSRRGCEPYGDTAKFKAQQQLQGQPVKLVGTTFDKYDRRLAHAYLEDDTWINGSMITQGLAHVYTFPDTAKTQAEHITQLLKREADARQNARGLWREPRWQIRQATTCCAKTDIGKFQIVEGKIVDVTTVKNTTYLNFGDDWRTDFTAEIQEKHHRNFDGKETSFHHLFGKTVRVRGMAKPVNGTLITVSHPAQIAIIEVLD